MRQETAERTLVVWCPDWPVQAAVAAAAVEADEPVAVVSANRVVACSAAARREGVARGLRRREAQARCPDLRVLSLDPAGEARAFEPVVAAVEAFAPRIEVVRPGVCALVTRGPSRYFGGDDALAARVVAAVGHECRVGVADGRFAAGLAARVAGGDPAFRASVLSASAGAAGPLTGGRVPGRGDTAGAARGPALGSRLAGEGDAAPGIAAAHRSRPGDGHRADGVAAAQWWWVVPPGQSGAFLAPFPVTALERPELADLLRRLGVRTLGAFAALPVADVVARFGPEGEVAHRLARGLDERPLAARIPPPDLVVQCELDPPALRVDVAAFAAKGLADELHARLAAEGLACTRVLVEAETEHGEHLARLWRHEGALDAAAVAARVRWQLDGWLAGTAPGRGRASGRVDRPTAGLTLLRLVPDEVVPATGRQLGFWGGAAAADERAARALARVQGIVGHDAVVTAVLSGGRSHAEQVTLVPWGEPRLPARPGTPGDGPVRVDGRVEVPPWPGRIPPPAPALVHPEPLPAELLDATGAVLAVNGRGLARGAPARLSVAGAPARAVVGWAGPWPVDERWWDVPVHRRRARMQVLTEDDDAYLLTLEGGRWRVEATYD